MAQDPINPNFNTQNIPNQYSQNDPIGNPQNFAPNPFMNDPEFVQGQAKLDGLMHNKQSQMPSNDFQNQSYDMQQNVPQYNQNGQLGGYNPYQNTGSNIQGFAPEDNFDTNFGQGYNQSPDFNQNGVDQYKSSTPQFNPNDPYLMPSTNPELDDLDENDESSLQKPQKDTKKILMFGLIGVIILLLVASLALFFLSQNKPSPVTTNTNTASSKPASIAPSSNSENVPPVIQNKTGSVDSPASKSAVNLGATNVSADWLLTSFSKVKNAVGEDGACKLQNVCGAKADYDKDGLNNLDEYIYGANPQIQDTDDDGISDKDELFIYHTDPKNPDTNGNTYKDGVEITNCYDPNIFSKKYSKTKLNEISTNVNKSFVNGLSEPTINTMKEAGAKAGELEKGYLTKCAVTTTPDKSTDTDSSPATTKNESQNETSNPYQGA
jgi:hypothetical protein